MRKEIGSEFWDIPTGKKPNNLFENATWFVSGRAAFRAILEQALFEHPFVARKIAIPSFLCESMIQPIAKENFSYSFYRVDFDNNSLIFDFSGIEDCGYILILDYFGYQAPQIIIPQGKITIRDLTHSVFSQKYDDADYYFGSLRKWAGFLTGGFAYKKEGIISEPTLDCSKYVNLRKEAMRQKKSYIEENFGDKKYLSIFRDAEELLDECDIEISPLFDIKAAKMLDFDFLKRRRYENAKILVEGLKQYCLFKSVKPADCPLCVPIIINNRDVLRKHLIEKNIYCPIHWPKPEQVPDGVSTKLYANELSLVCDQRYGKDDMNRIVETVLSFMESENNA